MRLIARWARKFGIARAVCIVLLFALVPLRILDPGPLQEIRLRVFDFFQVLRPRQQTIRPVVIVDIDEASLKEIGQWPWPRTVMADLVTHLTQLGAAVIGFDIVFPEPDRMSPASVASSLRDLDSATRAKLDSLPSNDEIFADAIKKSRVVVGQSASTTRAVAAPNSAPEPGYAVLGPDPSRFLDNYPTLLRNIPAIEGAAAGRGVFTMAEERDGIVRRAPVIMKIANGTSIPNAVTTDSQMSLGPAVMMSNHASQISSTPDVKAANSSTWRRRYPNTAVANMNPTNRMSKPSQVAGQLWAT